MGSLGSEIPTSSLFFFFFSPLPSPLTVFGLSTQPHPPPSRPSFRLRPPVTGRTFADHLTWAGGSNATTGVRDGRPVGGDKYQEINIRIQMAFAGEKANPCNEFAFLPSGF